MALYLNVKSILSFINNKLKNACIQLNVIFLPAKWNN